MPWLPDLHTPEEDRAYARAALARQRAHLLVRLSAHGGEEAVVGIAAVEADEDLLAHLYLHPTILRQGLGSELLDVARAEHGRPLFLWCFADNHAGLAFYAAQGAEEVLRTDGRGNEEGLPDVRLRLPWPPITG